MCLVSILVVLLGCVFNEVLYCSVVFLGWVVVRWVLHCGLVGSWVLGGNLAKVARDV